MQEILLPLYPWLKAGHIIFMVFWMAGLFILPRQMIYLHPYGAESPESDVWADRMGKLRKIILTPSLIVVWVLGLALMSAIGAHTQGWFHAKLLLVLILTGYHGWMVAKAKAMLRGERPLTDKQLRLWGEVPGIMLALIVILVVVKPF
ncbi:CopD family protein [Aurantiacibacter sediminis]|uniref:Protoporphyrinogen IX oxidase n=1 Tax=Aurantiacibacter sediminis TaxID=2793064 RepID=A0ABS0N0C4_9SPHN|nr:CopD family protein [Aurantiacibacter sediminis]MBH5321410.1 CopD family protein [Aurantiacibacter sediminis]